MIRIREEQPPDIEAIREVNNRAFGQTQEAKVVEKLRQNCQDLLSLVAGVRKREKWAWKGIYYRNEINAQ